MRFSGQGMMSHTASTTISRYFTNTRGKALSTGWFGLSTAELGDVKGILGNTQSAIAKGGDLMNPQKLFPTSFSTLTAPLRTASVGDRAIYTADGAVNAEFDILTTLGNTNSPR